jgi:hypothetical protein
MSTISLCTQHENPPKEDPTADMKAIAPALEPGEKEHVLIFHDEMAIHANDCQKHYWARPDETVLRKKDQGRLMMVSEFITSITSTGRLVMSPEQWNTQLGLPEAERLPREARVIIYPSSKPGADDYWNMKQMITQVNSLSILVLFTDYTTVGQHYQACRAPPSREGARVHLRQLLSP